MAVNKPILFDVEIKPKIKSILNIQKKNEYFFLCSVSSCILVTLRHEYTVFFITPHTLHSPFFYIVFSPHFEDPNIEKERFCRLSPKETGGMEKQIEMRRQCVNHVFLLVPGVLLCYSNREDAAQKSGKRNSVHVRNTTSTYIIRIRYTCCEYVYLVVGAIVKPCEDQK